jgi:gamma-glutamylcyclotransferase (GGCT)/AIG2-like uncharacterized protein YtfP
MLYFAYGSNMSGRRLQQRVPSARVHGTALLVAHRLVFHKAGRDGSAKCDAAPSAGINDRVIGVIYRMDPRHKPLLDAAEGLDQGYAQKTVTLRTSDGLISQAFTYYATHVDPQLKPFSWYKEHVLRGAREHALPEPYVASIAAIVAVEDPDATRHLTELAIYT